MNETATKIGTVNHSSLKLTIFSLTIYSLKAVHLLQASSNFKQICLEKPIKIARSVLLKKSIKKS